jgi:hypothetical protein
VQGVTSLSPPLNNQQGPSPTGGTQASSSPAFHGQEYLNPGSSDSEWTPQFGYSMLRLCENNHWGNGFLGSVPNNRSSQGGAYDASGGAVSTPVLAPSHFNLTRFPAKPTRTRLQPKVELEAETLSAYTPSHVPVMPDVRSNIKRAPTKPTTTRVQPNVELEPQTLSLDTPSHVPAMASLRSDIKPSPAESTTTRVQPKIDSQKLYRGFLSKPKHHADPAVEPPSEPKSEPFPRLEPVERIPGQFIPSTPLFY